MLQLPLKSVGLGYRQEKAGLVFELKEFRDHTIKGAAVVVRTLVEGPSRPGCQ